MDIKGDKMRSDRVKMWIRKPGRESQRWRRGVERMRGGVELIVKR